MAIAYATITGDKIKVILDAKIIGHIKRKDGGFAYFPKANPKLHGDVFPTIKDVKQSIEQS